MIAIPTKLDRSDSPVAPLFGKSKWFALVNKDGSIEFWRNEIKSGRDVVTALAEKGVTKVIFQEIGGNPFMLLQRQGIECLYAGDGRVLLSQIMVAFRQGNLLHVGLENMHEFVEKSKRHSRGEHHHEHGYHHHEHHHAH